MPLGLTTKGKGTYQLIDARLHKAKSLKGVKAERNTVELKVYVEKLKTMLMEGKHQAKNTTTFANEVRALVHNLTSEAKLKAKILNAYWKERFSVACDKKAVANNDQLPLF